MSACNRTRQTAHRIHATTISATAARRDPITQPSECSGTCCGADKRIFVNTVERTRPVNSLSGSLDPKRTPRDHSQHRCDIAFEPVRRHPRVSRRERYCMYSKSASRPSRRRDRTHARCQDYRVARAFAIHRNRSHRTSNRSDFSATRRMHRELFERIDARERTATECGGRCKKKIRHPDSRRG